MEIWITYKTENGVGGTPMDLKLYGKLRDYFLQEAANVCRNEYANPKTSHVNALDLAKKIEEAKGNFQIPMTYGRVMIELE